MEVMLKEIIHERIKTRCGKLFNDGYYPEACHRAFELVALTVKEITGSHKYGRDLTTLLELGKKGIKLRIPFGEEMQKAAAGYFDAAFSYYRNYSAHEGDKIDKTSCMRGLVVASELLELIGASKLSFEDIGGIQGLLKLGVFASETDIINLLNFLVGEQIFDDINDGFFEDLALKGFTENQLRALLDVGLIEYDVSLLETDIINNPEEFNDVGVFKVTPLGQSVINANKGSI